MDLRQSEHLARLRHLREHFAEANEKLVGRLRRATDVTATAAPEGHWSAAQIGWHVATVTNRFAGLIAGDLPGVKELPADFVERPWAGIEAAIPEKLNASAAIMPPPAVTRDDAISMLEAAGMRMARAFDAITAERGARMGIGNPIVGGAINVYQIGDWAASHTLRHDRQAARMLDET